jgi:1,4-alpha-glucan branching enzyme
MYKTLYHPDWIWNKLDLQVNHFIHNIENASNYHKNKTGRNSTVCLPFDTELFGHWWFEGPEFIRKLCQGLHNSPYVKMMTASEQLFLTKPHEVISLPEGSWGENNNHDVWMNEGNKWTWQYIYDDELRLNNILEKRNVTSLNNLERRILTQALRELMLMQSSDWQFLIYTNGAKDYAEQRFSYHHNDFNRLCSLYEKYEGMEKLDTQDESYLTETERRNSVFAELELEWWSE